MIYLIFSGFGKEKNCPEPPIRFLSSDETIGMKTKEEEMAQI
jgi:hypothetical protein